MVGSCDKLDTAVAKLKSLSDQAEHDYIKIEEISRKTYELHRDYIKHEDNLINNRTQVGLAVQAGILGLLAWLIGQTSSGYQSVPLGSQPSSVLGNLGTDIKIGLIDCLSEFSYNILNPLCPLVSRFNKSDVSVSIIEKIWQIFGQDVGFIVICVFGLMASRMMSSSVEAANVAIQSLGENWNSIREKLINICPTINFFPEITGGGNRKASKSGFFLTKSVGDFCKVFWLFLIFLFLKMNLLYILIYIVYLRCKHLLPTGRQR
jgi:hypothetical protein